MANSKLLLKLLLCFFCSLAISDEFKAVHTGLPLHVRRSSRMSHISGTIKFEIHNSLGKALKEISFAESSIKIGLVVPTIWMILSG